MGMTASTTSLGPLPKLLLEHEQSLQVRIPWAVTCDLPCAIDFAAGLYPCWVRICCEAPTAATAFRGFLRGEAELLRNVLPQRPDIGQLSTAALINHGACALFSFLRATYNIGYP